MPRRRRTYGLSFSWKRALGISAAKGRFARATGIPTTRSGRQRKMGRLMGCALPMLVVLGAMLAAAAIAATFA